MFVHRKLLPYTYRASYTVEFVQVECVLVPNKVAVSLDIAKNGEDVRITSFCVERCGVSSKPGKGLPSERSVHTFQSVVQALHIQWGMFTYM